MFIDEVKIKLIGGKGGDGCTSFRHEKYIEFGGPDGGSGGQGGNIVFVADEGLKTLIDLRYNKTLKAKKGTNGMGKNKTGAKGEDLIVKVPVGTTVRDLNTNLIICDLVNNKESFIVAMGGKGGKGNVSFKSQKNTAPKISEYGNDGEEKEIKCELKLLADVGLVGLPSVGKSSLISVITSCKPKIADYEFTTLTPNLGVVELKNNDSFVIADVPGLIEGASEGIGLGYKFLKHAERTRVIAHIIDMSGPNGRSPIDDYETINNELKKYDEQLYNKKTIVVANKMDILESKENLKKFRLKYKNLEIIEVSAITKIGLDNLIYKLNDLVKETPITKLYSNSDYIEYEYKEEKDFEIKKEGNVYCIYGNKIENLLKITKFNSDEAEIRFAKILKNMGVDKELDKIGADVGDTIKILDYEFEYRKGL